MSSTQHTRPRAVFFDVNETMLDLAPVRTSVTQVLGNQEELAAIWFQTLLHNSTVTALAGQYSDFSDISIASLLLVADANGIELHRDRAAKVVKGMLTLPAHDDVEPALKTLNQSGFQLFALTNSSQSAMETQLEHASLAPYFSKLLSVESLKTYKPDLRVYQWAAEQADVSVGDAMLVAAHGWDVAGALWAGMRAAFIQRPGKRRYPLGPAPEAECEDFGGLSDYLTALP